MGGIRYVVMGNKVDLVLAYELVSEGPRCVGDDLVDVSAVSHGLVPLVLVHDSAALLAVGELVVAHAHDQVCVGEKVFRLHELTSVARVEQVVDAVRVDADFARAFACSCHL